MSSKIFIGLIAACMGACAKHHEDPPPHSQPSRVITTTQGLPGVLCNTALMVQVTHANGSTFCIDRFEASVSNDALGNPHQGATDEDMNLDGTTMALATVGLSERPATNVSWYQAKAACQNAGKRLCSVAEWERACRGPEALIYPYGDTPNDSACNGFYAFTDATPARTGSLNTCGSTYGVYDLSGNVEEWVETAVPRIPGTVPLDDRFVRGGSFRANPPALSCVGPEFHAAPGNTADDRGFRCCKDF